MQELSQQTDQVLEKFWKSKRSWLIIAILQQFFREAVLPRWLASGESPILSRLQATHFSLPGGRRSMHRYNFFGCTAPMLWFSLRQGSLLLALEGIQFAESLQLDPFGMHSR